MMWLSFDLQPQDGVCRFDVFHIIIGASLVLTRISFKWIDDSNDGDTTTTTTTITEVWNY